jgi:hypothetical protein
MLDMRFQVQQYEQGAWLRSHKVLVPSRRPTAQQQNHKQYVPAKNDCQKAESEECPPLSLFHVALLRTADLSDRRRG